MRTYTTEDGAHIHVADLIAVVEKGIAVAEKENLRPDFRAGWVASSESLVQALRLLEREAMSDAVRQLTASRRLSAFFGL
jgi:hypothetical protein